MRYLIPILLLIFSGLSTGCTTVGVGAGVGTGSGGILVSSRNDYLYPGSRVYADNRKGLNLFLARKFEEANATFTTALKASPIDPDATFYLGLTRVYLGQRDAGLALLDKYQDPKFRVQDEVRWWAGYCRKKPEMTPDDVKRAMVNARAEGFMRDQDEYWNRRRDFLFN
ncbi:hypothetical protein GM415_11405 [Pseudodesulfovibrio cashew]|uniref:Tetratricopeptide repeat protein n=1 Tax=Pseudodesulfovibrio cashew TaxID=2678688 RepID=A0A6I6JSX0_9BACT|nr:tetratricopeptide repeat protein [Pseudodesulfovibrio cashew]QGY40704.1 hypothetical protein GM415_11405 [Pseudodesulfovibrio cashew]